MEEKDEGWRWWIGTDEERYSLELPAGSTREDAITEGRAQYADDEGFFIILARMGVPSLPDGQDLFEMFTDKNEDLGDPDGDNFGADVVITKDAEDELTAKLHEAFAAWLDKHKLWPQVYTFAGTCNAEYITNAQSAE